MNSKVAGKIAKYLLEEDEGYDYIKVKFFLESILGEAEKFILLLIIFGIFGYIADILLIMSVMLLLRPYLSGIHFKKYWVCFGYTLLICAVSIMSGHILRWNVYFFYISYVLVLTAIIILAPVKSEYRPEYKGRTRIIMKLKAVLSLGIICIVSHMLGFTYRMEVAGILCILFFDVVWSYVRGKEGMV